MTKTILVDCGRIRSGNTGLGQVIMQYADACMRNSNHDVDFRFLTHPAFYDFANHAEHIGATTVRAKFSVKNKIIRLFNKDVFPYVYQTQEHHVRHALHRQHLSIPNNDKKPFVLTSHDMHFMSEKPKHANRSLRQIKKTIARADCVVFISRYSHEITRQHVNLDGKETHVVYNGVNKPQNPQKPAWVDDNMRPFLLSVAQIERHKNYHIMPSVMSHLPDFNLILVGKKKKQAESLLREAIERENMQKRVFVPGSVSEGEKAWLMQHCHGFVFPSLKEGFGMPVVEALHFGKPVFCFNNTALPEVGGEFAFYWQNQEPKEMADLILDNISSNESIIAARQQWAAGFSWDKNAAAYLDIYRRLTNNS